DAAVDRAQGVDVQVQFALLGGLVPGGPGQQHAGVVHPHVDPAGLRDERVPGLLDLGVIAHVDDRRGGAAADLRGSGGGGLGVEVGDRHLVAPVGQQRGDV